MTSTWSELVRTPFPPGTCASVSRSLGDLGLVVFHVRLLPTKDERPIARLVEHLVERADVRLVGREGAQGPIGDARPMLGSRGGDVALWGCDDDALLERSMAVVATADSRRNRWDPALVRLESAIDEVLFRSLDGPASEAWRALVSLWGALDGGPSLADRIASCLALGKRERVPDADAREARDFVRMLEASRLGVEEAAAAVERTISRLHRLFDDNEPPSDALFARVVHFDMARHGYGEERARAASDEELDSCYRRGLAAIRADLAALTRAADADETTIEEVLRTLVDLSTAFEIHPVRFVDRPLFRIAQCHVLMGRLRTDEVIVRAEAIALGLLREAVADDPELARRVEARAATRSLRKLFGCDLSFEQAESVGGRAVDVSLADLAHAARLAPHDDEAAFEIDKRAAMELYDLARRRGERLVTSLLDEMARRQLPSAVLLAGGHHTATIERVLRERRVARVTVTPRATPSSTSLDAYRAMLGARST